MRVLIFILLFIILTLLINTLVVFRGIRISGNSMYPTFKDGDFLIGRYVTKKHKYHEGNIYIYTTPQGNTVIKRLKYIEGNRLFFLGDNPTDSYDSRHYGWVSKNDVQLIFFRRLIKEEGKWKIIK